jgi:hypothetical protein
MSGLKKDGDRDGIREEYLTTAGTEAELMIIEGILRAENILFFVRQREAGGIAAVYTGFSAFGADIYVSSEDIDRARAAVGVGTEPGE